MPSSGPGMGSGRPGVPNDGMQIKCGPGGFEVDEFGRPKMAGAKMDKPASVLLCLKFCEFKNRESKLFREMLCKVKLI